MKKSLLLLLLLGFHYSLVSQNKKVTYKVQRLHKLEGEKLKEFKEEIKNSPSMLAMNKEITNSLKIIKDLFYELVYNEKEAIFKQKKLDFVVKGVSTKILIGSMYPDLLSYKSKHHKYSIKETLTGKLLKINYPNNFYKWKLTNKTKKILGLQCKLAKSTFNILNNDGTYRQLPIFAWFTEEIPLPYGPLGIDNLPGLILECDVNTNRFIALSIEDCSSFPEIPKVKKEISIVEKQKKERDFTMKMMKRFKKRKK